MQTFPDVASGSFVAPDHEYPSKLILRLTATDAAGAASSREIALEPRTVELTLATSPADLGVAMNATSAAAPLTGTVIEGSLNSISADSPQQLGGNLELFLVVRRGHRHPHGDREHHSNGDGDVHRRRRWSARPTERVEGPPPQLELQTLKVRIPRSVERLLERGGRAKLSCNLDCRVKMKLVASGRDARKLGIAGRIAKGAARLEADDPAWVVARLGRRAARRLADAEPGLEPRIEAQFSAR